MPVYVKKNGKYKRRKNLFYKRTYNKGVKVLHEIAKIKKQLNVEMKWLDTFSALTAISTTPQIVQVTNTQQGSTAETRVGEQIKLTSLYFKYTLEANANAVNTFTRILIIQDMQTNGAIYTAADVFENSSGNADIVSPLNLKNKYRYRILYDKIHNFQDTGRKTAQDSFYKSIQMLIRYKSNNGDITDLSSNSLSIYLVSNQATNTPSINYSMRLRFVDN